MTVSVVIPAYNAARTIGETILSVIAQTVPDWEVIVVDDGSVDATAEIAEGFARQDERIRVVRQPNGGESAARNTGIEHARSDWLLFLDADDWISENHLQLLTTELQTRPDLDAVIGGSVRVTSDGTHVSDDYEPPEGDLFPTLARRAAFAIHSCIVRRSLVELAGKFDTTLRKSEDWDLWQRIARMGARFGVVHTVVAFYRMSAASATADAELMFVNGLRILKQGHAPDPRVPTTDPAYDNGLSGDCVDSQVFYLLSWCAGLLLGAGKDARGLLDLAREYQWADLHPPAIAKCIFDGGLLTTRQPSAVWETLLLGVVQPVEDYLAALEQQSAATNLAPRAIQALKSMILKNSRTWGSVIAEHTRFVNEKTSRIAELEETVNALDAERALLSGRLEEGVREIGALRAEHQTLLENWNALLARTDAEREERVREIGALRAEHQTLLENWNSLRAEHQTLLENWNSLLAHADAEARDREMLEATLASLKADLQQVQGYSAERALMLAALRERKWIRLGLGLGTLKEPDVSDQSLGDFKPSSPVPEGWSTQPVNGSTDRVQTWRLRVAPGNSATLLFARADPETLRIDIKAAPTKAAWDIQLDLHSLAVRAAEVYKLEFRVRADRSRTIGVGLAQDHEPWSNLGFYRKLSLTRSWQRIEAEFNVSSDDQKARIHFDCGCHRSGVELSELRFKPVGIAG